jgi:ParB family chromosome partitioning protein
VRDTEKMGDAGEGGKARRLKTAARKDADTAALEKSLSDRLGLAVTIDHKGDGGDVHVRYATLEQLDDIVRRLRG